MWFPFNSLDLLLHKSKFLSKNVSLHSVSYKLYYLQYSKIPHNIYLL